MSRTILATGRIAPRTARRLFASQTVRLLVDAINAEAITVAHCTPDLIECDLRIMPAALEQLAQQCSYDLAALTDTQRRTLAREIAAEVSAHPYLREA
jgi:light-regulated signal transduction histidine kinase (bacteriophytochrome)